MLTFSIDVNILSGYHPTGYYAVLTYHISSSDVRHVQSVSLSLYSTWADLTFRSHDVSWGTKGDNGAVKDLGGAKKVANKDGQDMYEVELPSVGSLLSY